MNFRYRRFVYLFVKSSYLHRLSRFKHITLSTYIACLPPNTRLYLLASLGPLQTQDSIYWHRSPPLLTPNSINLSCQVPLWCQLFCPSQSFPSCISILPALPIPLYILSSILPTPPIPLYIQSTLIPTPPIPLYILSSIVPAPPIPLFIPNTISPVPPRPFYILNTIRPALPIPFYIHNCISSVP